MRVDLKNIKYAAFASQETNCFEASVYIDGKREGVVWNDGRGGCNSYQPQALVERLEAYAKTLPPIKSDFGMLSVDADVLLNELLESHLEAKENKRLCKRGTLVRFEGIQYESGAWSLFKAPYDDRVIERLEKIKGKRVLDCLNRRMEVNQ